jgi:O-antigen/teichoic acid export membrane protein
MGAEQQVVYGVPEAAVQPPAVAADASAPKSLGADHVRMGGSESVLARSDQGFFSGAGFWSMADQGVVSAGNFFTTILLARCLLPAEYGVYALLFGLILMMNGFHSAFIWYGMSLLGASRSEAELRPLAGGSLVLTAALAVVLGIALGSTAVYFHRAPLASWLLLALLFWQIQETTRRALMCRLRFRDALWGDALSYLGQTACIAVLFFVHRLTIASAFGVMSATSAAAALLQAAQLKLTPPDFRGAFRLLPEFWDTGRWALLVSVAQAFIGQALLWFLALAGTAEVASFQSVLNLLRATNPVMFGIGSVLLPTVAAQAGKPAAGLYAARRYGLLGALVLLPYFALLFVFPGLTLRLFYGVGSPYVGLGLVLRLLVVGSAFAYVTYILGSYYYGLSKSYIVFRSQLVAVAFTVVAGLVLVMKAGVLGAAVAYVLTFTAQTGVLVWFLRQRVVSVAVEPRSIEKGERLEDKGELVGK